MTDDAARIKEEEQTLRRAQVLGMPYTDTTSIANKVLYKDVLSVQDIRDMRAVPLHVDNYSINFGITTLTSQRTMQNLRQHFSNQKVSFTIISDAGLRDYILLYDPPKKVEYQDIAISKTDDAQAISKISETLMQVRADDMLAYLVQQAVRLGASDIHLESRPKDSRIRFRVHGVLHSIAFLSQEKYKQLVSVLAVAANISTSVEEDQTGQINRTFKLASGDQVTVNLRVEAVATVNGFDAVLRLFNFSQEMLHLDKLGLSDYQNKVIRDIINRPTGLVMIVGPTGSGKTTTLYSILNELNNDERKIITLEDPVEYHIDGIAQIPVRSQQGDNFADKLRSVLRLDPDIIMVGEIRDLDTAKTALQAALTGHLVLSTYHANSAAGAITRLSDAIGENPLYASVIRLIQAQRLVRRLDDKTKQAIVPSSELEAHIQKIIQTIKADVDMSFLPNAKLYKPGTSAESPFGYNGQFAIRELLTMTPDMLKLLRKPSHELTTDIIEKVAVDNGMLTMKQDGTMRALKGDTTYEEIARVVG